MGHYPWFERLLAELGHELWLGDAAQVRASVVRRQKTDRRDAAQLLKLLLEERFPKIWVPAWKSGMCGSCWCIGTSRCRRGRDQDQLQAMALSHGVQKKWKLWTQAGRVELEQLPLLRYAAERRQRLLQALDGLDADLAELNRGWKKKSASGRQRSC